MNFPKASLILKETHNVKLIEWKVKPVPFTGTDWITITTFIQQFTCDFKIASFIKHLKRSVLASDVEAVETEYG